MCCSTGLAHFEGTTVAAWEIAGYHYLGYQNKFQNKTTRRISGGATDTQFPRYATRNAPTAGNAMILHFPAVQGTFTPDDMVDVSSNKKVLSDMVNAIPEERAKGFSLGSRTIGASGGRVFHFDYGPYECVVADNPMDIPRAIQNVSLEKRPDPNMSLLLQYGEWFSWPVLVACFNATELTESQPIVLRYDSRNSDYLFMPGLDAHDGRAPSFSVRVEIDHNIILGSDSFERDARPFLVDYDRRTSPLLRSHLPNRVIGLRDVQTSMPNGDFVSSVRTVRSGDPTFLRLSPHELADIYS